MRPRFPIATALVGVLAGTSLATRQPPATPDTALAAAVAEAPAAALRTPLDSALVGTVVVEGGRSLAIFQPGDGLLLVREGDEIVRGLRLVEVRRDRVVLEQDGVRGEIMLDQGTSPTGASEISSPWATGTPGADAVRKVADNTWEVEREGVAAANPGMGRVIAQVRLAQHATEGKPDGVEFTFIGQGGLFDHLGFQKGDIVRRVNGVATLSTDDAHSAYEAAVGGSEIRVELTRGGTPHTFTYRLR